MLCIFLYMHLPYYTHDETMADPKFAMIIWKRAYFKQANKLS